jgi:nucleoside-diphosphate-sugar epimerase
MIMQEAEKGRLISLIARAADFYGPENKNAVLNIMIADNLINGKKAQAFGNVDKIHTYTYTPDAAKATAILGNTDDAYNTVLHLPTDNHKLTGREFVELFSKEMNVPNKLFVMPVWMIKLVGIFVPLLREMPEMMYQYDRDYFFDSSKFDTRFKFKTTSYQEGVKLTVNHSSKS